LKVGVVVKVRRARAEVMLEESAGAAAGAAEKRVRVVEGRRRKEAKSLEAIVAVLWVVGWWCLAVRLLAAARAIEMQMRGGDGRGRTIRDGGLCAGMYIMHFT
jgi:hypothetical protein